MSDDPIVNDGNPKNDGTPAWMAQTPDDLKSNETLAKFPTIGDLSRSYLDLNGKVQNPEAYVKKLGENPSEQDVAAYYKALGRPDTPDGYDRSLPDLPEGYDYDKTFEQDFFKDAHDLGMSKKQASEMFTRWMNRSTEKFNTSVDNIVKQMKEENQKLRDNWGQNYDENLNKSNRAIEKFGGEPAVKFLKDMGLSDNPAVRQMFLNIYNAVGEDYIVKGILKQQPKEMPRTSGGLPMLEFPSMQKG